MKLKRKNRKRLKTKKKKLKTKKKKLKMKKKKLKMKMPKQKTLSFNESANIQYGAYGCYGRTALNP